VLPLPLRITGGGAGSDDNLATAGALGGKRPWWNLHDRFMNGS